MRQTQFVCVLCQIYTAEWDSLFLRASNCSVRMLNYFDPNMKTETVFISWISNLTWRKFQWAVSEWSRDLSGILDRFWRLLRQEYITSNISSNFLFQSHGMYCILSFFLFRFLNQSKKRKFDLRRLTLFSEAGSTQTAEIRLFCICRKLVSYLWEQPWKHQCGRRDTFHQLLRHDVCTT